MGDEEKGLTTLERIAKAIGGDVEDAKEALLRFQLASAEEKKAKAGKKQVVKTTEYTVVHKTFICVHCGFTHGATFTLARGETAHSIPRNPDEPCQYHLANGQERMNITTYVCSCSNCPTFIKSLSREELEDRYRALLHTTGDAVKRVLTKEVVR